MSNAGKKVEISRIPPPILPRLCKNILEKSKFFKDKNPVINFNNKNRHSYTQVLFPNIKEILKIKDSFPNISSKKIEEIHNTINDPSKVKLRINMTTKGPSRQQIIVLMGSNNIFKFMSLSSEYIANINKALKISSLKSWLTLSTLIIKISLLQQTRLYPNLISTPLRTTSKM